MEPNQAETMVFRAVDDLVAHLTAIRGLDPDFALAAVHSSALALICATHGGRVTAQCARESAECVEHLPSHAECRLAATSVAGWA